MDPLTQTYVTTHASVVPDLAGQSVSWVRQLRARGLSRFESTGFPTTRDEAWKYTNVRPITKQTFTHAPRRNDDPVLDQSKWLDLPKPNGHRLVFVNGHFCESLSDLSGLPEGARVVSLATVLDRDAAELEPYLGSLEPENSHGFSALNTAFLTDGAYIRLAAGCTVGCPIELFYAASKGEENLVNVPRNLIVAGPGSRGVIIERYASLGVGSYLTNSVTELLCAADSEVEHYKLQQENTKAFHVGGLYVHQEKDSRFTSHNVTLGGSLVRNDVHAVLAAEGAQCCLNGLYLGKGRQHVDNYTWIDHAKPSGTSREFYKGILDERARAVFHGRIVVQTDAQHTDAKQENKNLLLSRDAEVDTKPQLEIYADDVKCAHGATVGQLDPDQVFYLCSRGVDESTARSFLTYAFANDVLERIGVTPIRVELEQALRSRLLDGHHLEDLV